MKEEKLGGLENKGQCHIGQFWEEEVEEEEEGRRRRRGFLFFFSSLLLGCIYLSRLTPFPSLSLSI